MKHIFRFVLTLLLINVSYNTLYAQWVKVSGPYCDSIRSFTANGTNLFAGTNLYGVYISTNNGTSWKAVNTGLTNKDIHTLTASGTNIFAGTNNGVYLSTNNGTSWSQIGLTNKSVQSLAISGTNIFAGTYGDLVYLSTDNGTSWTKMGTMSDDFIMSLAISGTNIFAGTIYGGVFLSTNNGTNWTAVNTGMAARFIMCLVTSGTNLYAGTWLRGLFLSTNNGSSWNQIGLYHSPVRSLVIYGTNFFAGTDAGIYLSTNNGTGWTAVNTGLRDTNVIKLAISGNYLFECTMGNGIWRRPLSEMVTSVEPSSKDMPSDFGLGQNYPNPFNPSTTINYQLPKSEQVTIKVYDMLGNEVKTLVNDYKSAGNYTINFDGSKLGSGMYIYRITAGGYTSAKKMILIK
ncbi:MAG: T9SS type A sorting domain-containing protein [Bacteroidota bacterium]|nr:T9SS type A sorting domain-containing protein [Bacteroidota bacterium]